MTFSSSIFLFGFLPWIILFSRLMSKGKKRYIIILFSNLFCYLFCGYRMLVIACGYAFVVWLSTVFIARVKRKWVLASILCIVISPLISVKYLPFILDVLNGHFIFDMVFPELIVPVGISFFTFEAISLVIDVYKGKVTDKITYEQVLLYLLFFPTVTSGPIIRFNNFIDGLKKRIVINDFSNSIGKIVIGLSKKVLVADKIAVVSDYYFDGVARGNTYSCLGLWLGSIAFSLQLYFDFSGYSDMAIGIGQLLGFDIEENFNKPYQARSISDFWRRWHISLSKWFRDYIYIPIGGNRCSVSRHILNLLVVWLLTGIWHGADWSFIIWGMGYFILLVVEKYIPFIKRICDHWYGHVYTLFFVNLLWIPFRADDVGVTLTYIKGMFCGSSGIERIAQEMYLYILMAVVLCIPLERIIHKTHAEVFLNKFKGIILLTLSVLAVCAVVNTSYAPYIYGNF